MTDQPDVLVYGEPNSTVFLVRPLTEMAKDWVKEHVELDPWQWWGNGFGVGHQYLPGLLYGMDKAGLIVEPAN